MDKRFREMAEYAYSSVPLYMRREKTLEKDTAWSEIPILTKEEILKDPDSFYSCRFLNLDKKREVMQGRTSGSTGKCLELYWHKGDYKNSLLPVWIYRKKYYGIRPEDRMCYFYTTSNTGYGKRIEYEEEELGNAKGFSKNNLNEECLQEIYRRIIDYKPVWMFLQPSMAVVLCDAAQKTGMIIPGLKYIEFSGELLTREVRDRTEKVFGCMTANHYGCNEMNTIAFECPYGNMHIAENNVYVEIINDGKVQGQSGTDSDRGTTKEGKIVLTSAANRVMPFIRYDIGDWGRIKKAGCRCGCKSDVLEITRGRVHDYIKCVDGTKINAYIFVHAVEAVNRDYNGCIRQFQVVQKDYGRFFVKLAVDEEIYEVGVSQDMLEKEFANNIIHEGMRNVTYEFEFHQQLFPESGKFLWFSREF